MIVSHEEVLQHLLHHHGEHLRDPERAEPLSLGDFVTVNYVNVLYRRAKDRPQPIRFVESKPIKCRYTDCPDFVALATKEEQVTCPRCREYLGLPPI